MKRHIDQQRGKATFSSYFRALKEYLRRPKTIFDIKDRLKAFAALIIITFILWRIWQFVLQILGLM